MLINPSESLLERLDEEVRRRQFFKDETDRHFGLHLVAKQIADLLDERSDRWIDKETPEEDGSIIGYTIDYSRVEAYGGTLSLRVGLPDPREEGALLYEQEDIAKIHQHTKLKNYSKCYGSFRGVVIVRPSRYPAEFALDSSSHEFQDIQDTLSFMAQRLGMESVAALRPPQTP